MKKAIMMTLVFVLQMPAWASQIDIEQKSSRAGESISIEFTQYAESLYEKGTKDPEPMVEKKSYFWIGGDIKINIPYQLSVINENVTCYNRLPLSPSDAIQVVIHDLQLPPKFACRATINVEKR